MRTLIEAPRGRILSAQGVTTRLVWNPSFANRMNTNFTKAQMWLDNRILLDSAPYVPMITGALMKSGPLGTVIGSGEVIYNAPYARSRYYLPTSPSKEAHPKASRLWFEVAKAVYGESWIRGVKKIAGQGG